MMHVDVARRMHRLATIAIIGILSFAASATLLPLISEYSFAAWSYSLVLAFAAIITFFLNGDGQWTGLYQRAFIGTIALWLILVAIRLRSIATRSIEGREIPDDRSKTAPSS